MKNSPPQRKSGCCLQNYAATTKIRATSANSTPRANATLHPPRPLKLDNVSSSI